MKTLLATFLLAALTASCTTSQELVASDFNTKVLTTIKSMPRGGGYSGSDATKNKLVLACRAGDSGLIINPAKAQPSFCSSATYLAFAKVSNDLIQPDKDLTKALAVSLNQRDGHGVFGRWNANGPGCAKLVRDLDCGINFTDWKKAQAGDFLKIWWTDAIGGKERGHHVVYLGHDEKNLRFWSSNQPNGYGEKTIPRSDCARVLFTRITTPKNIANATKLSPSDPFLVQMLSKDFTWQQVVKACRVQE